jgi:two-component system, OmpR family, phosphate regulon sensor histidine kinase PhoR
LTGRIFLKLIFSVLSILIVALVAVDYLASRVTEKTYIDTLTNDLAATGRMLSVMFDDRPERRDEVDLQKLARALSGRLTLIALDGRVIRDSEADPARMENHASRPEVVEALHGRVGSTVRDSTTTRTPYLYVALPAAPGVLRLAVPLSEVRSGVHAIRLQMLTAVGMAFLPAILLAAVFARRVSARLGTIIDFAGKLADGRFEARLRSPSSDELGILERKLNDTGEKLQNTVEELQREHTELEKLERIRKDFVINVSHELRTPLASIQGYTETLLDGALHDPQNNVRFLSIIRTNAERLGRLTADLLTLSRIELKSQRFQFAGYYINSLVEDSVDSVRPIADKKEITVVLDAAPARTEVFCDSEAVHQILSNLLDNAIKYTPERSTIHVTARAMEGGDFVKVSVTDTGIGIPEEDLPRLFERFYRVDKARSRELGGTGLGLAIVKHLSKAMGGEVGVTSVIDAGSTFWFTLPVHDLGLSEESSVQGQLTGS